MTAAASNPSRAPGRGPTRPKRLRGALVGLAVALALAATFALYLRPGLTLDLGQLMAFCGLR